MVKLTKVKLVKLLKVLNVTILGQKNVTQLRIN